MTTLLLTLLIIIAGAALAWYRIKTRGVVAFVDETRRFIALQNSKDVMTFKATKRFLLFLWDRSSEQARRLYDQYRQKEKERMANREQEEKDGSTHRTQQARVRQPRQRSPKYALPTWIVPQQYDELNKKVGRDIFNAAVGFLVVFGLFWLLFILWIISLNLQ